MLIEEAEMTRNLGFRIEVVIDLRVSIWREKKEEEDRKELVKEERERRAGVVRWTEMVAAMAMASSSSSATIDEVVKIENGGKWEQTIGPHRNFFATWVRVRDS